MRSLLLCFSLFFTGCTNVVNSISDINNNFRTFTNQTTTNKIIVKNAKITEHCFAKSNIIKELSLNEFVFTKESARNEKWFDVFETLESKKSIGCLPKNATNYKEFYDSLMNLSGNGLELVVKAGKDQLKEKGFSKEERKNFSSKKGFTTEIIDSNKILFKYEYEFLNNYLSDSNNIITSSKNFAKEGGLK